MRIATDLVAMELNDTLFSNHSSSNETRITESDVEAATHPLVTLFGLPLGVLLVAVPSLAVIIIILKNRKLREKNNNVFYVNLLISDVLFMLVLWIVTSTVIICHLLNLPNVNCNIAVMPLYASLFGTRLMFLPVVVDRFLYVDLPFSYKHIVTTKRVTLTISSLWLLALLFSIFRTVYQDHISIPQHGLCVPNGDSNPLFFLIVLGTLVISVCIITGTSIYLRYKIIHSNWFFKSVMRTGAEKRKAVKLGRLVEILQEQAKPTFSVFIAGGIDAVFNLFMFINNMVSLQGVLFSTQWILHSVVFSLFTSQYFSHAVVYGVHDNYIRKEILEVYKKIRGPKKSKVIRLIEQ